jgi:hypothetical protein
LANADFSRFVENYVDAVERSRDRFTIAHVSLDEFSRGV